MPPANVNTPPRAPTDPMPNYSGARLVYGHVEFDDKPPCAPRCTVDEYPILAFQQAGTRWIPITANGPVSFWGELRVSTEGAFVFGVTVGGGVEGSDGRRFTPLEEFKRAMVTTVGRQVRNVRAETGRADDRLPTEREQQGN
jgi:hypothetical protein